MKTLSDGQENGCASDKLIRELGEPRIRRLLSTGAELLVYMEDDELQKYLSRYKVKKIRVSDSYDVSELKAF